MFLSRTRTLAPAPLLPGTRRAAFGVGRDLTGGEALASHPYLYLRALLPEAAPKYISGSTSYLRV